MEWPRSRCEAIKDLTKIRLALVDDHTLVVECLVAGLRTVPNLDLVATGESFDQARELLGRSDIDVVLLDVRLAGGNGLQALAERGRRMRPAVLVLSSFTSAQYVAAAARFGASGFLLKTVPLVDLVSAIRVVAEGGTLFSQEQLAKPFVSLTAKERAVIRHAMQGLTNKEIAERTGVSRKSVEAHLSTIFTRLSIRGGRIELAVRAAEEGWLDVEVPTGRTARTVPKP